MKQLVKLTSILVLVSSSICTAQTYLEPTFGISYSKNDVLDTNYFLANQMESDKSFVYTNLSYGLNLWQVIFDRMDMGLILNYQRNYLKYNDWGVVGYTDRRHDRFFTSLITKCKLFDHFELGFGPTIHHLFNGSLGQRYSGKWSEIYSDFKQNQLGVTGVFSIQLKSVKLHFSYNSNRSINNLTDGEIEKTKIISLSLGYNFKISENSINLN